MRLLHSLVRVEIFQQRFFYVCDLVQVAIFDAELQAQAVTHLYFDSICRARFAIEVHIVLYAVVQAVNDAIRVKCSCLSRVHERCDSRILRQ